MPSITYPASQAAPITDPDARAILTTRGLPSGGIVPFYPAETLSPLEIDPGHVVIGRWGREGVLIAMSLDGRVVGFTPWVGEVYPVNTSLRRFVDCVDAINAAAPLSPDNASYNTFRDAGEHVHRVVTRIDPEELDDPDSFWLDIVDDVKVGNFASRETRAGASASLGPERYGPE